MAIIIGILFACFYLFTSSQCISVTHDAPELLIMIARTTFGENPNLHSTHMTFNLMIAYWIKAWIYLGIPLKAPSLETWIPHFNSVIGGCVAAWVYWFLSKRLHLIRSKAILGTFFVSLTYTLWFYSTCIEVYMPSLFCVLCTIGYLSSLEKFTVKKSIGIGVLFGLTILFHLTNGLLLIGIIWFIFKNPNKMSNTLKGFHLSLISAVSGILVLCTYLFSKYILFPESSWGVFLNWILAYPKSGQYWHSPFDIKTYGLLVIGIGRSFLGGHFFLKFITPNSHLISLLHNHYLEDESFLVRSMSVTSAWILLTGLLFTLLFSIDFAIKVFRKWRPSPIEISLLIVGFPYCLFFIVWDTQNTDFWLLPVILFQLIIVSAVYRSKIKHSSYGLAIITFAFFSINYFSSFRYSRLPENCLYGSVTRYNLSHKILLDSLSDRDQRKFHIYYEWEKTKLAFP